MSLKFIGQPSQGIGGIPARDLTDAEVRSLPFTQTELIASGLYEKADEPKTKKAEADASNDEETN
jgi:hypothetical protein